MTQKRQYNRVHLRADVEQAQRDLAKSQALKKTPGGETAKGKPSTLRLELEPGKIVEYETAGDRMRITTQADGRMEIDFDDKGTGRVCGSCQLCCKLLPVPPLRKPGGQRCGHQRAGKGCVVWHTPAMPNACQVFACRWLADPSTAGMPRPDRAHYVIDLSPDYIVMTPDGGDEPIRVPVFQVWLDPAFPDAENEPGLRGWMLRMAEQFGHATILRYSPTRAKTIFPPAFDAGGKWHEQAGDIIARTAEDKAILAGFKSERSVDVILTEDR